MNGEILPLALSTYVEHNIDFTDAVIGVSAKMAGTEYLASFDKKHMDKLASLGLKRVEKLDQVL
jgi:predicted nucleic-acid-binding protein